MPTLTCREFGLCAHMPSRGLGNFCDRCPESDLASENAQAQRELDSLAHDDDPQPGAFYGLTPPDSDWTAHDHAEH